MEWVLVVMMLTPGGDFIDKYPVFFEDKKTCQASLKLIKKPTDTGSPLGVKIQGWVCVTRKHWEGKEVMPGVPLD
jgi:hypothetical protein